MGTARLQSMYIKAEAVYGDATGDFSSGLRVYPIGGAPVDLKNIQTALTDPGYVTGSFSENMPEAEETLKSGTFTTEFYIPGASLSGDNVDDDSFTDFMELLTGASSSAAASDACDAGCTASVVKIAGATTWVAGQLVNIGGETRKVLSFSTPDITLTTPLSSAPVATTKIYNVETYNVSTAGSSFGIGFEHAGAANYDLLLKGCVPTKVGLAQINTSDNVKLVVEWTIQDYTEGTGVITNPATTEVPNKPVSCAAGGDVATTDASDALLSLCAYSAEVQTGAETNAVKCFTSPNGLSGFAKNVVAGLGSLALQVYEDGTPIREKLTALIGKTREINIQVGTVRGKTVGMYIQDAHLMSKTPDFVDNDGLFYVESNWRVTPDVLIYRA